VVCLNTLRFIERARDLVTALSTLFAVMSAMPYVLALLMGVLIPALGVLCYSSFSAGLVLITGMFAIEALWMEVGGLQLGIKLYYTDFALVLVAVVALLRFFSARDTPRWHWAWGLYLLAFTVSLGTGLLNYGSVAGVQARSYFYCFAAGSYAMSFKIERLEIERLLGALASIALLLLAVCAYRWTVYYLPITELLPEGGVYNVDGAIRVVFSREAMILGQVFVTSLFFASFGQGIMLARFISPLVLSAVLVLQHRSVWLALLVGLMGGLLVGRSRSGSKLSQVLLLFVILTVTALPMVMSETLSGVTSQVAGSASTAVAGTGTVGERFQNWQALIRMWATGGPKSLLFGQSFGTDATRYVQDSNGVDRKIDYAAHNHYVQTLYNLGLVGLFGFLALVTYATKGLYRLCAQGQGDGVAEVLLTLLLMQLAYYVPYSSDYLQSVILGVAVAYVAQRERAVQAPSLPRKTPIRRATFRPWSMSK
jgi:O-Antigen ligase